MSIKGTVSKTYEKEWDGQDGKVILHSFQIQGDRRYFRTGTDKVFTEGESVQFEVAGNNQVKADSVTKLAAEVRTAPAPSPATGGYNRPAWGGKPKTTENFEARQKYWENKELRDIEVVEPRITWSSSRTAAVDVVGLALQHDAIAFGNATKGAKLGMILDFVDEVAARFYHQSMAAAETAGALAAEKPVTKGAAKASANSDE